MNLRASAIVMKSLPATVWGDALLISREEARRIGYELEQAAERIDALEARATPALPQAEHDLEDVRCQCCGYMTYHSEHMGCIRSAYKQALPQVPEGMAIVPVELLSRIMELAGVALVYQPFGTKDRQNFHALMAIIEDKP